MQVHSTSDVPLFVVALHASRHNLALTFVMVPSELMFHFWLFCPLHSQIRTLVPLAVPRLYALALVAVHHELLPRRVRPGLVLAVVAAPDLRLGAVGFAYRLTVIEPSLGSELRLSQALHDTPEPTHTPEKVTQRDRTRSHEG